MRFRRAVEAMRHGSALRCRADKTLLGITDAVGDGVNNTIVSFKRPEAVRGYLVSKGIAPERLEVKGHGERHPLPLDAWLHQPSALRTTTTTTEARSGGLILT